MKLIYESPIHCVGENFGESAESVQIYQLTDPDEFFEIDEMSHEEKCDLIGVVDESLYSYGIPEGAFYDSYSFDLTSHHLVVYHGHHINC